MSKKALGIILTNICNASCQICCFGCSPQNHQVMDEALMLDLIKQATTVKSIEYIGFSGGESFLFYDRLKKGINYAKALGFRTFVATNGFWGKWADRILISRLSDLHLDRISISTDYYHSQFIPPEIVERAIKAAKEAGITVQLTIGETKSGKSCGEYYRELGTYKYLLKVSNYPYKRVGRAESLPEDDFFRSKEPKHLRCQSNGFFSIRYDGRVFPCCEPMVFDTTLSLGNIKNRSLTEILLDKDNKALEAILRTDGFDRITEIAKNSFKKEIPKQCVGSCEICHTLFKDRDLSIKLKPFIDAEYGKIAVTKLFER